MAQYIILSDPSSAKNRIKTKQTLMTSQSLYKINAMKLKIIKKNITPMDILEHSGIKENKDADKYAKLTVSNKNSPTLKQIPYDDFKSLIKINIRNKWHIF